MSLKVRSRSQLFATRMLCRPESAFQRTSSINTGLDTLSEGTPSGLFSHAIAEISLLTLEYGKFRVSPLRPYGLVLEKLAIEVVSQPRAPTQESR